MCAGLGMEMGSRGEALVARERPEGAEMLCTFCTRLGEMMMMMTIYGEASYDARENHDPR